MKNIEKISKKDKRYEMLKRIPKKTITDLGCNRRGYKVYFSNPHYMLIMMDFNEEVLFVFVNNWQDEAYSHIYE
jgi:hypothetical protein